MYTTYFNTPSGAKNRHHSHSVKALSKAILAITLSSVGVAHADDYSSVTFFGDSLTDGGYFKEATEALGNSQSGQYTTNPDDTWATPFAESLGLKSVANTYDETAGEQTQTGNNYAIGGARSGIDVDHKKYEDTSGEPLPVYSTLSQVDSYLANKNIDQNGMYTVWSGANDLFAAAQYIQDNIGDFLLNKEETVAKAMNDNILPAAQDQVSIISTLHNNGAKYILVPNIPDVGLTPETIQGDEALKELGFEEDVLKPIGNTFAKTYNEALYSGIKNSGANVIPLDTFSLVQKVAADPTAYGFSNVTGKACKETSSVECGRNDLAEPGAENSYFFADGVHPTGRAHQMIADYANVVVTAPSQVGLLPHIATQSALATNERLQTHINQLQNHDSVQQETGPSVWATADINALDVAGFDSSGNLQLLLGMDLAHNGSSDAMSGIYGNISQSELDNTVRNGIDQVDLDEYGVGVYHSNKLGKVQVNGALGYGSLDLSLNRKVSLDNYSQDYKSDVDGKRYYATLQAGYPMQIADRAQFTNITITPYLAAMANRVEIDAINEKDMTDPLAMQFDEQEYNTIYGTLGVKANSRLSNTVDIFGDLHFQKQLDDDREDVKARLNTLSDMSFNTPVTEIDEDSFGMSLGLSRQFGAMNANAGVSYAKGDDDEATSVFVGLNHTF